MKRRSRAGGEPIKGRRGKTPEPKRRNAPKFTRYSEDQRRKIEAEVELSRRRPVDMVDLLDRLERFGRNYASLLMDLDWQKKFVAAEKRATKFRRQLAEEDRLPPEWQMPPALRQHVADIERFCQERIFQLGEAHTLRIVGIKGGPASSRTPPKLTISSTPPTRSHNTLAEAKPPRNQNARLAPLDSYCMLLYGVWMSIGGDWWSKSGSTKAGSAAVFISVCTEPVAGKTSTTVRAIRKRLSRLVKSGAIVAEDGSADAARRRWAEFGQNGNDEPGQTKPD